MKTLNEEMFNALERISDMCEDGRLSVNEIFDSRTEGHFSFRHVDSAAAVTRGHFLTIKAIADKAIDKAKLQSLLND